MWKTKCLLRVHCLVSKCSKWVTFVDDREKPTIEKNTRGYTRDRFIVWIYLVMRTETSRRGVIVCVCVIYSWKRQENSLRSASYFTRFFFLLALCVSRLDPCQENAVYRSLWSTTITIKLNANNWGLSINVVTITPKYLHKIKWKIFVCCGGVFVYIYRQQSYSNMCMIRLNKLHFYLKWVCAVKRCVLV